jgi:hypothetical protein
MFGKIVDIIVDLCIEIISCYYKYTYSNDSTAVSDIYSHSIRLGAQNNESNSPSVAAQSRDSDGVALSIPRAAEEGLNVNNKNPEFSTSFCHNVPNNSLVSSVDLFKSGSGSFDMCEERLIEGETGVVFRDH